MSLFRKNFDDIAEADLAALVAASAPESLVLEFKQETYGLDGEGKREFLKDISAFANSSGGHLVVGMKVDNGGAAQLIAVPNAADEIDRLENLARDGLQPRIILRAKQVKLNSGGAVIVVYVPRSAIAPHRVSAQGVNRFYVRNSGGVHEADVGELRRLFTGSAEAEQAARNYREQRVGMVAAGQGPVDLEGGGRLFVHLIPLLTKGQGPTVDLNALLKKHSTFRPLSAMGMTPRLNMDGMINIRGGERCFGYTQVGRTGVIESTKAGLLGNYEGIPIVHAKSRVVTPVMEVIDGYILGLSEFNVPPPYVVMISLEGVAGAKLATPGGEYDFDEVPPFRRSEILLPEVLITEMGTQDSRQAALRPAFDALWNAAGKLKCSEFDDEGRWRPTP